jgi:hypothetical protein
MENSKEFKTTIPKPKVPIYLDIEQVGIIGKCGKNYAHKLADFIIKEHPDKIFKGKRIPSKLLIENLGITIEQAEELLLEHENKSHSL